MPSCPNCHQEKIKRCNSCHKSFGIGDVCVCFEYDDEPYHVCDSECLYDFLNEICKAITTELVKDF